jgi:hypothetical protein
MQRALAGRAVEWRRDDGHRVVAEEHKRPAGAEQPVRLGQPEIRVAPDRGAVFGDGEIEGRVGQARGLRVAFEEGDVEPVFALQPPRGGQLFGRDVDPRHPRAPPRHPGRDIARAAAQLDRVHARHVIGQEAQLLLRQAPVAPGHAVGGPGMFPAATQSAAMPFQ